MDTVSFFFFFQAEDGIRDYKVTGVQTCALPILGLGGAAMCSNAARGQQNPPIIQHSTTKKRIAQVVPSTKVDEMKADPVTKPFFDELKRLGYVEGENLIVERYSGEGRLERYDSLAHEVVDTKPDLIWA